jgi:hypothetical protein
VIVPSILTTQPLAGILFVAGWVGGCALSAYFAGWRRMARRFPLAPGHGDGEQFRFASGFFATYKWMPVSFHNCLGLMVGAPGVRFSVFPLWQFYHTPYLLPWDAVESLTRERYMLLQHTVIRVRGERATIRIARRAGRAIAEEYARYCARQDKTGAD